VMGLASSGVRSKGYSLINRIIETTHVPLEERLGNQTLWSVLLTPTTIYANVVMQLASTLEIHGLCHITGGGLVENVPRVIPAGLLAKIDTRAWKRAEIFDWLQRAGEIGTEEMYRVFNCGIGMLVILSKEQADEAITICQQAGQQVEVIGEITRSVSENKIVLQ